MFYYRCPDHNKNYVLSVAFAFDKEEDTYQVSARILKPCKLGTDSIFLFVYNYVQFAYCYPYTYSRLQLFLEGIERLQRDYFKREHLCQSVVSSACSTLYDDDKDDS